MACGTAMAATVTPAIMSLRNAVDPYAKKRVPSNDCRLFPKALSPSDAWGTRGGAIADLGLRIADFEEADQTDVESLFGACALLLFRDLCDLFRLRAWRIAAFIRLAHFGNLTLPRGKFYNPGVRWRAKTRKNAEENGLFRVVHSSLADIATEVTY
jgi:hypothetical protein